MSHASLGSLTVIVPVYNELDNLPELRRRLSSVVASLGVSGSEVILVSDGSTDGSEALMAEYVMNDPLFVAIFLTRNFGHQAAVSVGLAAASGDVVCVIDGDLQDPPEAIPELLTAISAGADVAFAIRTRRKESMAKRFAYSAFYRLLQRVSNIDIPLDSGDFCCMRRCVVDAMLQLPERNRFVRGLRAWVGFKQVGVSYERSARFAGRPKYNFWALCRLAYDGIFSFTELPVKVMQFLGFAVSFTALLVAVCYALWRFFSPQVFPTGFATIAISLWFLAGVQLLFLGVLGEYVVRTFDEVRRRPTALVRETLRNRVLCGGGHEFSATEGCKE
jgi:dolichol-phosphate mannosyltransferase